MQSDSPQQAPWSSLVKGVVVIALGALAFATLKLCHISANKTLELGEKALGAGERLIQDLPSIAENFRQGKITETFRASLPRVAASNGDVLELATIESDETVNHEDTLRVAWDWINLGTTVAEVRARVTYRYHLRLSDPWELQTRSNVCIVIAPSIRPSLPPAIHTDTLEKRAESGWARFDKQDRLDELERSLTGVFQERATDSLHMDSVREACRKSVAEYVRNWLLLEDHWRADRFTSIIVHFPDELQGSIAHQHTDEPAILRLAN